MGKAWIVSHLTKPSSEEKLRCAGPSQIAGEEKSFEEEDAGWFGSVRLVCAHVPSSRSKEDTGRCTHQHVNLVVGWQVGLVVRAELLGSGRGGLFILVAQEKRVSLKLFRLWASSRRPCCRDG